MPDDLASTSARKRSRVGGYILLNTIGTGAFAKVKLAQHIATGTQVAVKIIKRRCSSDGVEEFQCLRHLHHPNIAQLLEVFATSKKYFLVMEYASGGHLLDYLERTGRMAEEDARALFRQLVSAVHYCHQRGITHRDLKPENILLDSEYNIKIADFGFGREFSGSKLSTFCGTISHMAPEILRGQSYEGPKVDSWSVGVILFQMVTGRLPFTGEDFWQVKRQILKGRLRIPSFLTKGCQKLLKKVINFDPSQRLSLEGIMLDPWVCLGQNVELTHPSEPSRGVIDPEVTKMMVKSGFDLEEVKDSVTQMRYNSIMGTYNILYKMKTNIKGRRVRVKPFTSPEHRSAHSTPEELPADEQKTGKCTSPPTSVEAGAIVPTSAGEPVQVTVPTHTSIPTRAPITTTTSKPLRVTVPTTTGVPPGVTITTSTSLPTGVTIPSTASPESRAIIVIPTGMPVTAAISTTATEAARPTVTTLVPQRVTDRATASMEARATVLTSTAVPAEETVSKTATSRSAYQHDSGRSLSSPSSSSTRSSVGASKGTSSNSILRAPQPRGGSLGSSSCHSQDWQPRATVLTSTAVPAEETVSKTATSRSAYQHDSGGSLSSPSSSSTRSSVGASKGTSSNSILRAPQPRGGSLGSSSCHSQGRQPRATVLTSTAVPAEKTVSKTATSRSAYQHDSGRSLTTPRSSSTRSGVAAPKGTSSKSIPRAPQPHGGSLGSSSCHSQGRQPRARRILGFLLKFFCCGPCTQKKHHKGTRIQPM